MTIVSLPVDGWQNEYRNMIATAEKAVEQIKSGYRVFVGTGCAQPEVLLDALVNRAGELVDTEIVHLLTLGHAPYAVQALSKSFRVNSFFIYQREGRFSTSRITG